MRLHVLSDLHLESLRWLQAQASLLRGNKVMIVTHHAPCPKSIPPDLQGDAFNPAYASDRTQFITESEAKVWIHGHIHSRSDYTIGHTRVLANPRGYPNSPRQGFDPGLVVEV